MSEQDSPVLVGLNDISAYVKRSKPVVRRMIQNDELPVRLVHGAYMTTTHLLNEWLSERAKESAQSDSQIA